MSRATKVTICGGGNGAHALAGIAAMDENNLVTVLYLRERENNTWNRTLAVEGFKVILPNGTILEQHPGNVNFKVTWDVQEAVISADVVILVCPAYGHEFYFDLIAKYLSDHALVIGMPGRPGFEYQCLHHLRKYGKGCSVMNLESLPWTCRVIEYGHSVKVLGIKDHVYTSIINQVEDSSPNGFVVLAPRILGESTVLRKASSALEITLNPAATIHPCIMYAKWNDWKGEEFPTRPLFYQDVNKRAATYLDTACNETIAIADKVRHLYPQLLDTRVVTIHQLLIEHYDNQITDKTTLLTSLKTNKAYDGLVHPMTQTCSGKFVLDFSYRYMTEDVPYGIVVQRAIAEMLDVETPMIDSIITWAQKILGVDYLVDGKVNTKLTSGTRIPQMYGLTSIGDVLNCSSY